MHILALIMLVGVALFGGYILLRRSKKQPTKRWMTVGHGVGAVVALLLLLIGVYELYSAEALNDWVWISLSLIVSVVVGGFLIFEKWLKGKRKPFFILLMHGVFATTSIGVLAYSYLI